MILDKKIYDKKNLLSSILLTIKLVILSFIKSIPIRKKKIIQKTSSRYRGLLKIRKDEDGKANCDGCNVCVQICPTHSLRTEVKDGELKKIEMNVLACLYCGLCEDVCHTKGLYMSNERPKANHVEANWILVRE